MDRVGDSDVNDYVIEIAVVGESGVGKSNLMSRYLKD